MKLVTARAQSVMRIKAVSCLVVVVWVAAVTAGCGSHSSSPSSSPAMAKTRIAGGLGDTLALRGNGSLWSWGRNQYGQLGLGDTKNRLTPNRVGTANDWAALACGQDWSLALKTDGSLWAWGDNRMGALGLGDIKNRHTPTRVGTASDWAAVACGRGHSLALKTDGSLWAWGWNDSGQLGQGGQADEYGTSHPAPGRRGQRLGSGRLRLQSQPGPEE